MYYYCIIMTIAILYFCLVRPFLNGDLEYYFPEYILNGIFIWIIFVGSALYFIHSQNVYTKHAQEVLSVENEARLIKESELCRESKEYLINTMKVKPHLINSDFYLLKKEFKSICDNIIVENFKYENRIGQK